MKIPSQYYSHIELTNTILEKSFELHHYVQPIKLQKLLYIVNCEYIHETGMSLLSMPFDIWLYGPVLTPVHNKYGNDNNEFIKKYLKDAKGVATVVNDAILDRIVDEVFDNFGYLSNAEICEAVCRKGSAWRKKFENGEKYIDDVDMSQDFSYRRNFSLLKIS